MESISHQDVRLDIEKEKFKFRVAGIIEHKDKVLVMKMQGNPFACCPGGHVELLEDTKSAAIRELKEELYFEVEVKELMYVHENFFSVGDKRFHELCFYYKAQPKDKNINMDDLVWEEVDKGKKLTHQFMWYDKEQLKNLWVEPRTMFDKYLANPNKFEHFVTVD